jgi:hypothetical protein
MYAIFMYHMNMFNLIHYYHLTDRFRKFGSEVTDEVDGASVGVAPSSFASGLCLYITVSNIVVYIYIVIL